METIFSLLARTTHHSARGILLGHIAMILWQESWKTINVTKDRHSPIKWKASSIIRHLFLFDIEDLGTLFFIYYFFFVECFHVVYLKPK